MTKHWLIKWQCSYAGTHPRRGGVWAIEVQQEWSNRWRSGGQNSTFWPKQARREIGINFCLLGRFALLFLFIVVNSFFCFTMTGKQDTEVLGVHVESFVLGDGSGRHHGHRPCKWTSTLSFTSLTFLCKYFIISFSCSWCLLVAKITKGGLCFRGYHQIGKTFWELSSCYWSIQPLASLRRTMLETQLPLSWHNLHLRPRFAL